jgi:Flagellar hook-length control protein FliK
LPASERNMPISVSPVLPVNAVQNAAPTLVLQPGTVVDATVLKILSADLVRIVINSLSIDVLSQVPLQAGQALQLAVSQTQDGIRLAVVGQGAGAAADVSLDSVSLAPGALVDAAANPAVITAPSVNALTPVEKVAVAAATQIAATQQGSLAPLFANLGVVAGSSALPSALQQAVAQVLAQQTPLDESLTGGDVQNAFQTSGLFLEASLAAGTVSSASGIPDLKAALIVLRQTLLSSLGTTGAVESPATATTVTPQPVSVPASTLAPSLSTENEMPEILLPQTRVPVAADTVELESRATTVGEVLNLLQEAVQEMPRQNDNASLAAAMPKDLGNDGVAVHTTTPPPPFRGAVPAAQAIASPSIAADAPLATSAHQLLGDTDAAIARQTLLQVASLPDQAPVAGTRIDPATPRWSFEIPFATPQGTAVTQFEIARDGGGNEVEAAKRVWRARFSLDIEPAGPVHALVSLNGDRTSVRMWAERPATAAQLREGAAQLSQALSRAELQPGDIVIRDGVPPSSAPAPAGHFLDRAL